MYSEVDISALISNCTILGWPGDHFQQPPGTVGVRRDARQRQPAGDGGPLLGHALAAGQPVRGGAGLGVPLPRRHPHPHLPRGSAPAMDARDLAERYSCYIPAD